MLTARLAPGCLGGVCDGGDDGSRKGFEVADGVFASAVGAGVAMADDFIGDVARLKGLFELNGDFASADVGVGPPMGDGCRYC